MKKTILLFSLASGILLMPSMSRAQGGTPYERVAIMNGNQVRTIFGNWGVIGQPAQYGHRGAWRNDNDGYLGDVSPLVGAEIHWDTVTFHSVATVPVNRPTALRDQDPITNAYWTFEPLPGYFNANKSSVAMSNDPTTWPPYWPDKLNDPTDPGWKGSWNGYFGKRASADLETYFVMDDNADQRFNFKGNNIWHVAFKPDSTNPSRNGMALRMSVRALQWAQFLAQDNIFWLYEITNEGTTTYDRAVFGMLVGTYVGVTSTEDYHEYDDDWSFYDVTQNLTYTGDFGRQIADPLWVGSVGMVGYAFLESPGNPFDGIDNDGDADSSAIGRAAPLFTASDFDSTTIMPGQQIILINDDYTRHVYTVPSVDSVLVYTRGLSMWIKPGKTKVAEGNLIHTLISGNTYADVLNTNAYDGVDNNFNGLIDENYQLHFHQIKRQPDPTLPPLIDIPRAVRHMNYLTGAGSSPYSMIDERRDDLIDNNLNWNISVDDVGRDGIPNTGDYGEGDGLPTSGYDNSYHDTGLPGEPHIDKTDVKESDQLGLTNFYYFTPSNVIILGDDESLWSDLKPGYFDVPKSIVNNKPINGEDGDFVYGSGYFPLLPKTTERFSLALVYGGGNGGSVDDDIADLLKHKVTVQKIYDANYQFPQPPNRPTLTAVAGDHSVTLYWDRVAEATIDPVLLTKTFEGYKIYKSTDPNFSDIHTITDGSGEVKGYRPLVQFDLNDAYSGYFEATGPLLQEIGGYSYYLGSNTGLQHSYVDNEVVNGQQYYYAVVAYSRGDEALGILPAENTFSVSVQTTGVIQHESNVAVVTPNSKTAGYVPVPNRVPLTHVQGPGTGTASFQVVDQTAVNAHHYRVEFLDTQVDGIDNNGNGLIDAADSSEWTRQTSFYSVRDLETQKETFVSDDTLVAFLSRQHLDPATVQVTTSSGTVVNPSSYRLDASRGTIRGVSAGSLPRGTTYTISYQYYPVFKSPNIQGSPFTLENPKDADVFDGIEMVFNNNWYVIPDSTRGALGWTGKQYYTWTVTPLSVLNPLNILDSLHGYRRPADYRIEFYNSIVDTGMEDDVLGIPPTPVNFRVYDETDSTYIRFIFSDPYGLGHVGPNTDIVFMDKDPQGLFHYSWDVPFTSYATKDSVSVPGIGDRLLIKVKKPFRAGDTFEFTTTKPQVDQAQAAGSLSRVRAVPNPYVTASTFEPPLPPGITSGRGTRKIEFIHVPTGSTIRIFTARGDHVATLHQDGNIEDGSVSWDLKTSENLDVAFGVYFYVVESPVGSVTGKLAIIK